MLQGIFRPLDLGVSEGGRLVPNVSIVELEIGLQFNGRTIG